MNKEKAPKYSREEIKKIERERALSDSRLLEGGADLGSTGLSPTKEQVEKSRLEMGEVFKDRKRAEESLKEWNSMSTREKSKKYMEVIDNLNRLTAPVDSYGGSIGRAMSLMREDMADGGRKAAQKEAEISSIFSWLNSRGLDWRKDYKGSLGWLPEEE